MAGIKIVDLPALGRDLAATDLLELSLAGGTGSRKITGQEIINASKLNVGTTPIINGTAGRLLFQGTGDILQQSANLSWDNTSNILTLNGDINYSSYNKVIGSSSFPLGTLFSQNIRSINQINHSGGTNGLTIAGNGGSPLFRIYDNGNVIIQTGGTFTDAGFKLDVNGTARVTGQTTFGTTGTDGSIRFLRSIDASNVGYIQVNSSGLQVGNGTYAFFHNNSLNGINAGSNPLAMWHIKGSGNTSSTTSLLVQQSTGVNVLSVRDDMYVTVQNTNNTECFQVRGANDDATIRFTPSGGTGSIILKSQSSSITLSTTANSFGDLRVNGGGQTLRIGTSSLSGGGVNYYSSQNGTTHSHRWFHNNGEQMSLQYTGNFLIGTTTDAGYRLDVNGTAIVRGILTINDNVQGKISADNQYLNLYHNGGSQSILSFGFGSSIGASGYLRINQNAGDPAGTTSGTIHRYDFNSTITNSSGTAQWNFQSLRPNYNFTGTYSGTVRGFYYNPTLTSMTGVTHFAFHSTSGRVRFEGLPTSPTGLNAGDIYNDGGTLRIV